MSAPPDDAALDLERLDAAVERAVRAGDPTGLRVLGYGEITLTVGWPAERPQYAVKRLPPFAGGSQLDRYRGLLERYIAALRGRGVEVVPTAVHAIAAAGAAPRGYLVQPYAPRERQLVVLLRAAPRPVGAPLVAGLAERVARAVDRAVGLDAQASNWVVDGERLACFDVSTPLMRSPDGRDELDLELFLSIYPWALRGPLRLVAREVMAGYHDARTVMLDVASNLLKERLDRWLPDFLAAANLRLERPLDPREVRRYFARDKVLWTTMQRLRRADRAWQRRVRRRPYPFLLPPPYRYGAPQVPESEIP